MINYYRPFDLLLELLAALKIRRLKAFLLQPLVLAVSFFVYIKRSVPVSPISKTFTPSALLSWSFICLELTCWQLQLPLTWIHIYMMGSTIAFCDDNWNQTNQHSTKQETGWDGFVTTTFVVPFHDCFITICCLKAKWFDPRAVELGSNPVCLIVLV